MNSGRIGRAGLMTAVVASASVYMPAALAQSTPSNAELAHLVKQQAAQIQRLNARIDELEKQKKPNHPTREIRSASGTESRAATENAPDESLTSRPSQQAPKKTTYASNGGQGKQGLEQRVAKLEKSHVKVDWSNGAPELSSPDGDYTFGIGGRVQYDFSSTFSSDYDGSHGNASRNNTGTEFRRLRLDAHGKVAGNVLYKLEADFVNDGASLRDAYLAAKHQFELGQGMVFLGNKFSDRGLIARTSSKWTWFTERNTVANNVSTPAAGAYETGISGEFYGDDDWHATLAVNKGTAAESGRHHSSDFNVLSRVHWDPIHTDNLLLHVGAHGFYERFKHHHDETRDPFSEDSIIAGHYNGNLRIASDAVDDPKDGHAFGFELAGLSGPFAAGAEWGRRDIESRDGPSMHLTAYSGQIGYSLTGEQFGYSTKMGVFTHPDVAHPVFKGGWGAWQLVARYQALDFQNDASYHGGTGHGTSVGLDWYLNDWVRTIVDYTHWRTHNREARNRSLDYIGPDDGNTINARAQIVF